VAWRFISFIIERASMSNDSKRIALGGRWVLMATGLLTVGPLVGCDKLPKMDEEETKKETVSTPSQPPATTAFPGSENSPSAGPPASAPSLPKSPQELIQAFLSKQPRERTNQDLEQLAGLPEALEQITTLDLGGSQVGDAGLAHLPKLAAVETLNISSLRVTNDGLKPLAELPKLRVLAADNLSTVDEGGLKVLGQCRGLEEVSLQNSVAADGTFDALRELKDLKVLKVGGSPNLMGMGFSKSVEKGAFKDLKELHAGNSQFVIYGVLQLGKLKGLEVLDVSYADMNDGLIDGFDDCINLKKLSMVRSKVTSEGLRKLLKMRKLEELNVSGCPAVNDSAVPYLRGHKELKRIDLDGTNFTPDGVKKLKAALPETVVRFGGVEA
jgi:hypothetical protein